MKARVRGLFAGLRLLRGHGVKERLKQVPTLNEFLKATAGAGPQELPVEKSATLQGRKYFIETYGCQMNEADSEIIRSILEASGMTSTREVPDSDVVLLNTCAIRENAENKVFQRLSELRAQKKKSKGEFLIGVLGCMAERLKVDLLEKNKAVDMVVGPDAYRDLPRLISDLMVAAGEPVRRREGFRDKHAALFRRDIRRHNAGAQAERRPPRLHQRDARLQQHVRVLHRALHPRPRALAAPGLDPRRGPQAPGRRSEGAPGSLRKSRCWART